MDTILLQRRESVLNSLAIEERLATISQCFHIQEFLA